MRWLMLMASVAAWTACGCSSESAESRTLSCNPPALQACQAACGRGVQECSAEAGGWSECVCAVHDASFEVSLDAQDDASFDAPDSSEAADASWEMTPDAEGDSGADAVD
jgi:hypothetical protein